jgi:ADP-ribosylglycohydrolase
MLGAVVGDVIGSVYERSPVRHTRFAPFPRGARFTDDTVLTVATADAILTGRPYRAAYLDWAKRYPAAGYGPGFKRWMNAATPQAGVSMGNGSAMRVSPVAYAFNSHPDVLREAAASAVVSHNHPEGIKGAQAVALAVYLARGGKSKAEIRAEITTRFQYDLDRTIEEIRPTYRTGLRFDMSCEGSVPEAIIAFLDSVDVESAIRLAVSLAGDSDTQACIAGAIAEAHYGSIPEEMVRETQARLTPEMLEIIARFRDTFVTVASQRA